MSTDPLMFSRLGRYALRTVAIVTGADQRVTGKTLSAETGIPSAYQSKVLRQLVEADILSAKKGHHGGFALAHPAETIRLADVLDSVGALPAGGACVFGWGQCSASKPCPLHNKWSTLSENVMNWAEQTTLADLTAQSA